LIRLVFSISRLFGETPAPTVESVHDSRVFIDDRLVLFHIDPAEFPPRKRILPLWTSDFDGLVRQLDINTALPDAEEG